jgi:hypothetical protein
MSVSNILDANHLIKQEFIPQKLTDKIKALEEFVRVISEAIEIEGYVYNGEYQGVYDRVPEPDPVPEPEPEPVPEPEPEPEVPTEPESSG